MKKFENECVNCDLPCIGSFCRYLNVPHYYCDYCGEEETLYDYDGDEVCASCLLQQFTVIEGSDIYY